LSKFRTLAKLAAESKKKPEVFIATSAVGYYPTSLTAKYTEDYISSASLDGWAAGLCHKIEDASAPASEAGIRTVQMRMGVIMGRGGGAYANMKLPLRLGVVFRLYTRRYSFRALFAGFPGSIWMMQRDCINSQRRRRRFLDL